MDYLKIYIFAAGLLFSVAVGHIIVKFLNQKLRAYIEDAKNPVEKNSAKLTPALGCIERAAYTLLFLASQDPYIYIVTVFGLKIAQRLILLSKLDDYEKVRSAGERINVYLICNVVSLGFGLAGGWLIKYFWQLSKC